MDFPPYPPVLSLGVECEGVPFRGFPTKKVNRDGVEE
jgi:hypothetical protein